MEIKIKTIKHEDQRYATCGDWQFDEKGNLEITVSGMNNWKYEFLIAFHELAEVMICKSRDISQESVDAFDISFEKMREQFPEIIKDQEPGFFPTAPYRMEHEFATGIEKMMAGQLGVDWIQYDSEVSKL